MALGRKQERHLCVTLQGGWTIALLLLLQPLLHGLERFPLPAGMVEIQSLVRDDEVWTQSFM